MVVEIISPSSYKRDHFKKENLYQQYGITEYWLVDPSYRSVEIFVLQKDQYVLHAFGVDDEKIESEVIQRFILEVSSLFLKKEETKS